MIANLLQYQYLIGMLVFGLPVWLMMFRRKHLRSSMIHSGIVYTFILLCGFLFLSTRDVPPQLAINPGYWHPATLFDLNNLTGGLGFEDIIFMFLGAGIATGVIEFCFGKKIKPAFRSKHHYLALIIAILGSAVFYKITQSNLMYALIIFNACGALAMCLQRPDLSKHALLGGAIVGIIYFLQWQGYNLLFPDYIAHNYSLQNISNIFLLGVPIEEILFGLTFGLFWSPEIEYETGKKSSV